jgi:tRNA G10  N-methylase Trm11
LLFCNCNSFTILKLCNGQNAAYQKYNLKDRKYIGNTTMDPLLALIMASMAQVKPSQLVYDPFVGTGGLLVGAAHCGAHVAGADLDFNMMHARGLSSRVGQKYRSKSETIMANLKQYGLEKYYVDVLIADFSTQYLRASFKFDAIVTDPPYGIREKAKKLGAKKKQQKQQDNGVDHASTGVEGVNDVRGELTGSDNESGSSVSDDDSEEGVLAKESTEKVDKNSNTIVVNRFPQHTKYMLSDIFHDLLRFAVKHLEVGARLVFWLPVYLETDRFSLTYVD